MSEFPVDKEQAKLVLPHLCPDPLEGEIVVTVWSAVGGFCGQFLWNDCDLQLIKDIELKSKHFHMKFEERREPRCSCLKK